MAEELKEQEEKARLEEEEKAKQGKSESTQEEEQKAGESELAKSKGPKKTLGELLDTRLTKDMKLYMLAGRLCFTWTTQGKREQRHLYMTQQFDQLIAKDMMKGDVTSQALRMDQVQSVRKFDKSLFPKAKGLFAKKPNPACCFILIGKPEANKNLYIECGMESEANKWYEYLVKLFIEFNKLVAEIKK